MEGGTSFNALNFNLAEYNDAIGANYTGASQVVAVFLCPSSTRSPDGGRDGTDPNDPFSAISGGYGYNDYGPTVYTDISPLLHDRRQRRDAVDPIPRQDHPCQRHAQAGHDADRRGHRRTSNTIAIAEDAGRDPRYLSPYTEGYWNNVITRQAAMATINPNDPGPSGGYTPYRRFWRWAEPDEGYGVSGTPNNTGRPDHEVVRLADGHHSSPRATTPAPTTRSPRSTRAGPISSSATATSSSSRTRSAPITMRGLVTPNGGEVLSSDSY